MTIDRLPSLAHPVLIDKAAVLAVATRHVPGYDGEVSLVWGLDAPVKATIDHTKRQVRVYVNALTSNAVACRDLDNLLRAYVQRKAVQE